MGVKRVTGSTKRDHSNKKFETGQIFSARVIYCMLDDKTEPEAFKSRGEWASIGGIFFENVKYPGSAKEDVNKNRFAKPLFPNLKNYPLKNEIVYIITLSSTGVETNTSDKAFYYFQPVNIWNSIHHNAIPDGINNSTLPPSQKRDYQQTEAGAVRKVTDGGTEIDLGDTFKEKLDTKSLQPFEGDIIHEGRWGQSIRFGSTVNNSKIKNPWSKDGKNGDPITIIKNKQRKDEEDPWVPQVEDINGDGSSVYLTSTQSLPINVGQNNKKYSSYTSEIPTIPEKYNGEQIILNSNRILFNTKNDHLILNSNKTISLNSEKGFNFETPSNCVIKVGTTIELGDKDATEPAILGEVFLTDFGKLLEKLSSFLKSMEVFIGDGEEGSGTPEPALRAAQTNEFISSLINNIDSYKSQIVKIKK